MQKKYSQLSESSKKKLSTVLSRLHKSGITVKDTFTMSDTKIKQALGFKGSQTSFKGLKRNILQLQFTQERQESISNKALISYTKVGYRGKGLSRVKSQLRKTVGLNIFFDISKDVQKKFNLSTSESYRITDKLIKRAKSNYKKLTQKEKELLSYFS